MKKTPAKNENKGADREQGSTGSSCSHSLAGLRLLPLVLMSGGDFWVARMGWQTSEAHRPVSSFCEEERGRAATRNNNEDRRRQDQQQPATTRDVNSDCSAACCLR
ncbi:unnamed protein product [Gongylonema pulchrum]|uniref:Secreted protein n=1 Tax=Gongylonema pulchrum TaxID=637853 RepID=A0A183EEC0_9BILA|nr:unnamed protein product [Gongylonema pulchrum]